jgi:hypothetical protein
MSFWAAGSIGQRKLNSHAHPFGWLFYREPFGVREAVAMLIIFAGVAIVKNTVRVSVEPRPPRVIE